VKKRRLTARIEAPFPARLKGVDSTGRVFTEHSVLDNLSNGGLHMCVMRGIPLGVEVTVAVRLSADAGVAPVLRLAARGTVVRTDPGRMVVGALRSSLRGDGFCKRSGSLPLVSANFAN
jgi:hypothetical protein